MGEEYESVVKIAKTLAEHYRNKIMFVTVDIDEDDHRRIIEFLGLKGEKFPTMRIIQMKDDIVVGKIDATINELSHSRVRSFPTIRLYKKDENELAEYNGERTLEGLKKFIETDGVYGMAAPDHDEL